MIRAKTGIFSDLCGEKKMHSLLDYGMLLPHYVLITDGKKGDNVELLTNNFNGWPAP